MSNLKDLILIFQVTWIFLVIDNFKIKLKNNYFIKEHNPEFKCYSCDEGLIEK